MVDISTLGGLIDALKPEQENNDTTYIATVSKIDNDGIVWVYLSGSDKETPTALSSSEIDVGDIVSVQWRNNKLYIAGNASNPSAGLARTYMIQDVANKANDIANIAIDDANRAREAADNAQLSATVAENAATEALESSTQAQRSADNATTYANTALAQLGTVQDVVDVLEWTAAHSSWELTSDTEVDQQKQYWLQRSSGDYFMSDPPEFTYSLTSDTEIQEGKTYYIRGGSGTIEEPYYYIVVDEPDVADIGTYYEANPSNPHDLGYYEIDATESVSNYIASHLALLDDGLYITADDSGYRVKLDSTAMYVINPSGNIVGQYGETMQMGADDSLHLIGTSSRLAFCGDSGDIAYFGLGDDDIWQLHIDNASIDDMLRFGDYAWIKRSNGNMSLKWLGD